MNNWNRKNPRYRRSDSQGLSGLWSKFTKALTFRKPAKIKRPEAPKSQPIEPLSGAKEAVTPIAPKALDSNSAPDYSGIVERLRSGQKSPFQILESKLKAESNEASSQEAKTTESSQKPLELSDLGREVAENLDLESLDDEVSGKPSKNKLDTKSPSLSPPKAGLDTLKAKTRIMRPCLLGVLLIILVIALCYGLMDFKPGPTAPTDQPAQVAQVRQPLAQSVVTPSGLAPDLASGPMAEDRDWRYRLTEASYVIEKGGSLSRALEALGLSQAQRRGFYQAIERKGILTKVMPGEEFRALWSDPLRPEESLERLEYRARPGDRPLVFLPGGPDGFICFSAAAPAKKIHQATEGTVTETFWGAGEKAGLEPWVILHLIDLMASQVDFVSDIRKGDDFQLLFLGEYQEGRLITKPVIEMIRLTNDGNRYEFYRHVGDDGREGYFDVQFRSINTNFFKSPLQYSRISSGFSLARAHPILKIVRPHLGVDYAAPEGTPVSAVADGVVVSAGFRGDYGRLVVLDHSGEYRTMYGHLSRIAKGLAPGVKVAQGELIGNVGMSGLATGPHLDFRLLHKGKFVDPEVALKAQEGKPMPSDERMRFAEAVT
ncbi:MAG: M23 family metallopeptidase, partial [Deltaproteobacteria bacterium]|nr:M23 family metallopeptidase [Deltaproteobacteria bacterium]